MSPPTGPRSPTSAAPSTTPKAASKARSSSPASTTSRSSDRENHARLAPHMITGIDHIAILVRDFDATVKSYETVFGRAPNWLGFMAGGRHAWFQFDDMALDIIGSDGSGP